MNALECIGVGKRFKNFALRNIDLELPAGYFMGLVGRNGAGKTTLLRLIMNHLHLEAGQIKIYGYDHDLQERAAKSKVAMASELGHLPGDQSIKNLARLYKAGYPDWNQEKFDAVIRRFDLPQKSLIDQLSKGAKALVTLALTVSQGAQLLLLDEPTAGLDPVMRKAFMEVLREELEDESVSIIFATHVTADIEDIMDFLTILHQGEIVLNQSREQINDSWRKLTFLCAREQLKNPEHLYGWSKRGYGGVALTDRLHELDRETREAAEIERVSIEDLLVHLTQKGVDYV